MQVEIQQRAALSSRHRYSLPFILCCVLLVTVWLAGGASKPDQMGQVVVRITAWGLLIATVLFGPAPAVRGFRAVFVLLGLTVALVLLQLLPLPPSLWPSLPGRELLVEAAAASGQPQPWRPLSMVPGATWNAAGSLIVPVCGLILFAASSRAERDALMKMLLAIVTAALVVAIAQFSDVALDNPLINDAPGQISGPLANRNHFALLLACGCVLAAAWAMIDEAGRRWRRPVAVGLVALFVLTIVATGSRAGLVLGAVGLAAAVMLVIYSAGRRTKMGSRRALLLATAILAAFVAVLVVVAISSGRSDAIDRVVSLDVASDLRARSLPTVTAMISHYFPFGSGFGGFDPVFRLHEPVDLLQTLYFNHAHNDFLEVALDGGLPGMLLVGAALLWVARRAVQVWRARKGRDLRNHLAALAIILLIAIASLGDYPARTPLFALILVLCAGWLADEPRARAQLYDRKRAPYRRSRPQSSGTR